jgi:hypothetical protein
MEFGIDLYKLLPSRKFTDPDKFIDAVTYSARLIRVQPVIELPKVTLTNAIKDNPAIFLLEFTASAPRSRNQFLVMPIGDFSGIQPFNSEDSFAWNVHQEQFLGAAALRVQEMRSYLPPDITVNFDGQVTYRDLGYTFN